MKQQGMITRDNYEEYLFLEADGELDNAGRQALTRFLTTAPDLARELEELRSLKLSPDKAITFEEKASLLKASGENTRVLSLPARWWLAAAAAAGVAGIIWLSLPVTNVSLNKAANTVAAAGNVKQPATTVAPVIAGSIPAAAAQKTSPKFHRNTGSEKAEKRITARHDGRILKDSDEMTALSSRPAQLPVKAGVIVVAAASGDNGLLQSSPITKSASRKRPVLSFAQLPALQNLKNAAGETLTRISNSPYNPKDVALTMKLGNRNFSINF